MSKCDQSEKMRLKSLNFDQSRYVNVNMNFDLNLNSFSFFKILKFYSFSNFHFLSSNFRFLFFYKFDIIESLIYSINFII